MNYTPERILSLIDQELETGQFARSEGFSFRPGQHKTIAGILYNILNNLKEAYVLDATTGSGKSILALFCSQILTKEGLKGYIVTADTELQRQYMRDIEKYKLPWNDVMGVDHYDCHINESKFSIGECRLRGLSYEESEKLTCYQTCGYLQARKKSMKADVAILNYSYWLIQMNFVMKEALEDGREPPFKQRDFIFFDEAHKIDDIVQSHFAPRISYEFHEKIETVNDFLDKNYPNEYELIDFRICKSIILKIYQTEKNEDLFDLLEQFERLLANYVSIGRSIAKKTDKKFNRNIQIPKEWKRIFAFFDLFKDMLCKIEDYTDMVLDLGLNSMLKNPQNDHILFNILSDKLMLLKHLHQKAGNKVFMSATLGSINSYAKNNMLPEYKAHKMLTNFDFSKSPIFVFDLPKLTYQNKLDNYQKITEALDKILDKLHPNDKGIIHTTSYEFVDKILSYSKNKDRFFNYIGSKQKKEVLQQYLSSDKGVLIGPSLLEGLDLKDDTSRFQIFFKMPYANISDLFVKKKAELDNGWYRWKSAIAILQGVGRSVRSEDDWAKTYMLDGSFKEFINNNIGFFPEDFLKRITIVKDYS